MLTGKATIKVNGKVLNSNAGATCDIGGVTRTPVNGSTKYHGTFETPKNSMVNTVISVDENTSLAEIRDWRNATVVFEADTGQRYLQKGGDVQDPPVLTGGEGGAVPVVFLGPPMDEL